MSRPVKFSVPVFGFALMIVFVLGLCHSISTGFAVFWGGFPFMVIATFVIALALYDLWEEDTKRDD